MTARVFVLSLLLIPACAKAPKVRDVTAGQSNVCPVHHVQMEKREARFADHTDMRADAVRDYLAAQRLGIKDLYRTRFPFAETRAHTHTEINPPDVVLKFVCRKCVEALWVWRREQMANQAPEPTPGSVTPRATEGNSK